MLAAEAVEHQLHVRTHTSRFAQFHSRKFLQRFTQVFGRILQFTRIYSYRIEGRALDASDSVGNDYDFIQLGDRRFQDYILLAAPVCQNFHLLFYRLKPDSRNSQCIFPGRCFQMIQAFFVGCTAILRTFQVHRGEVNNTFVRRKNLSR